MGRWVPSKRGLISSKVKSRSMRTLLPRKIIAVWFGKPKVVWQFNRFQRRTRSNEVSSAPEMQQRVCNGLVQGRSNKVNSKVERFPRDTRSKGWWISHVGLCKTHGYSEVLWISSLNSPVRGVLKVVVAVKREKVVIESC